MLKVRALTQRVIKAHVSVADQIVGEIAQGILALVAVQPNDTEANADKLLHKLLNYRMFGDENNKMNRSLTEVQGGLLLVSQFTLAADTKSGLRPSFSCAASPELGRRLFNYLVEQAIKQYPKVATGCFGANMQVALINDGPVTFLLDS